MWQLLPSSFLVIPLCFLYCFPIAVWFSFFSQQNRALPSRHLAGMLVILLLLPSTQLILAMTTSVTDPGICVPPRKVEPLLASSPR